MPLHLGYDLRVHTLSEQEGCVRVTWLGWVTPPPYPSSSVPSPNVSATSGYLCGARLARLAFHPGPSVGPGRANYLLDERISQAGCLSFCLLSCRMRTGRRQGGSKG